MIIHSLTVGPFQENCYIIGDPETRKGAVIDPGSEPEKIIRLIDEHNLSVDSIFNTHGHIDHIGAIIQLQTKYKSAFYLHKDDETLLGKAGQYAAMYGLELEGIPEIDHQISDGDELTVGRLKMRVIHTPGHTRGGCCFYFPDQKNLFTGDTLFRQSIGRTDLPGGDYKMILKSIREQILTLPAETDVYPGHGPQTTIGFEKINNPFLQ